MLPHPHPSPTGEGLQSGSLRPWGEAIILKVKLVTPVEQQAVRQVAGAAARLCRF